MIIKSAHYFPAVSQNLVLAGDVFVGNAFMHSVQVRFLTGYVEWNPFPNAVGRVACPRRNVSILDVNIE